MSDSKLAGEDLQALRERLAALDHDLLRLIRERMAIAERVAGAKLAAASPFRDPAREDLVLQRVRHAAVELGLDAHRIESLYRVILDMSVSHQQAYVHGLDDVPLRVAYQGIEGSNSHLAAQLRYGGRPGGALLVGTATLREACAAVAGGTADVALLPIENSTAGSINETYDLLAGGGVVITGEAVSAVEHCLLALPGVALAELRAVLSHPQALAQCAGFFHAHPEIEPRPEFDTAGAARKVRELGDRTLGALASAAAAERFGLAVVQRGVQDEAANLTRFVELRREAAPCPPDLPCKTSLLVETAHRPAALGEILTELGRRGVNLTKLESRPIPARPWQYRFYVDCEGHAEQSPLREALAAIRPLVAELRVLGTYPRA